MPKIDSLTIFSNGNIMAFSNGEQMGEIQTISWFDLLMKALEEKQVNPTEITEIATVINGRQVYLKPIKREDETWTYTASEF